MQENMSIENPKMYLDTEAGIARLRGNKKLYRRMLILFMQGKEFDTFEESMAEKDFTKAADVAHAIKGTTGSLSMPALYQESAKLMVELREGVCDEETLAKYRDAVPKTRACIEAYMAREDA